MRNLLTTLLHFAVVIAKLYGPGGVRAVIAENLVQPVAQREVRRPLATATKNDQSLLERLAPLNAPSVSSGVGASQVPPTVLVEPPPEEARTESAERCTKLLSHGRLPSRPARP